MHIRGTCRRSTRSSCTRWRLRCPASRAGHAQHSHLTLPVPSVHPHPSTTLPARPCPDAVAPSPSRKKPRDSFAATRAWIESINLPRGRTLLPGWTATRLSIVAPLWSGSKLSSSQLSHIFHLSPAIPAFIACSVPAAFPPSSRACQWPRPDCPDCAWRYMTVPSSVPTLLPLASSFQSPGSTTLPPCPPPSHHLSSRLHAVLERLISGAAFVLDC